MTDWLNTMSFCETWALHRFQKATGRIAPKKERSAPGKQVVNATDCICALQPVSAIGPITGPLRQGSPAWLYSYCFLTNNEMSYYMLDPPSSSELQTSGFKSTEGKVYWDA